MPLWAKEISPGPAAPPMIEVAEAVWCGPRNGRMVITSSVESPAIEWSLVIAIISSGVRLGRRLAAALANNVLPAPGGPEMRML